MPILRLAEAAGLGALADERLSVPTDKGANAGAKVSALVARMVAGADSIEDMALLRHGGMGRVFERCYAPSTLWSFLRTFTFGHVRQLDAVASRFVTALAALTPVVAGVGEVAVVDIDDTIIEVHGYTKQGAGFGYTQVRGLNALIATISTDRCAPVIVAQPLRKGSANSARGAQRLVRDALKTVRTLGQQEGESPSGRVLLRADSAYYGHAVIGAAVKTGAEVSVTVRLDARVKAAISGIAEDAWTTIEYPHAVFDEETRHLDLLSAGRRGPLCRVHLEEKERAGTRPAGRAPHPRLGRREEEACRAGRPVRAMAAPRLLHHHRRRGS